MVEERSRFPRLSRRPSGLILYAPGVAIRKVRWDHGIRLVGDNGRVTQSSLTSAECPPHEGRIYPDELLTQVGFGIRLLTQAFESRRDRIPSDIPVLTFVAGEKSDVYADSPRVIRWVQSQRSHGSQMSAMRCEGSRHELDNEVEAISTPVREESASFAAGAIAGDIPALHNSGPCTQF
jgi:hypothetical protein